MLNCDKDEISKIHSHDDSDRSEIGIKRAESILNEALRMYKPGTHIMCPKCKIVIPILTLNYSHRTKRLESRCPKCKEDLTRSSINKLISYKPVKLLLDTSCLINQTLTLYISQNWIEGSCIILIPNIVISELRLIEADSKRKSIARKGFRECETISKYVQEGKLLKLELIGEELDIKELEKNRQSNPHYVDDILIKLCKTHDSILVMEDETSARLGSLKGISVIFNTKIP